ncbi:MAG TPA: glutamyl-tRNA reductase, partial [Myxococcales bacterium]|nr:glutamyl-tRNA reductase [Myxococcales bacterium]
MNLLVVGINHRNADVDLRERFAVARDDISGTCRKLVECPQIAEAVVVSTCNRVEVYVSAAPDTNDRELIDALHATMGSRSDDFYDLTGEAALKHLMRVSASLDSMVLGEPQILGQIKEAFALAQEAKSVGSCLYQAFTAAIRTAKKVRSETAIAQASVSVGHVAVELARTIFGELDEVKVLLVGAGKMGVLAASKLAQSGARKVLVINRTFQKAKDLADTHEWSASVYEDLTLLLADVDVVICSTGARHAVLTQDVVRSATKKRRFRPLFLIDIAVPRDIEPGCGDLSDVYLYNIDDLEEVSKTNAKLRQSELNAAEAMIENQLSRALLRQQEQGAEPMIVRLRKHTHRL